MPLAVQWMNTIPKVDMEKKSGSFVAIGTFHPEIEIWNLDVMDAIEPTATLGGKEASSSLSSSSSSSKKNKKKQAQSFKPGSHEDSVISLAWTPAFRSRLASGSADTYVKLWDVTTQQCTQTLSHHKGKIQSLEWNPFEPNILLSGAYDQMVAVIDSRNPKNVAMTKVGADIECVKWHPHQPYLFLATTEAGIVTCHDIRTPKEKPLFTLSAHDDACTSLSFNNCSSTLFATCGLDETVKLWDMTDNKPTLVASRKMQIGKIFCMNFDKSSPFLLAAGGDQGLLGVWDTLENAEITKRYGKLLSEYTPPSLNIESKEELEELAADHEREIEADEESKEQAVDEDIEAESVSKPNKGSHSQGSKSLKKKLKMKAKGKK
jgi:periodic tryptophan protein 1